MTVELKQRWGNSLSFTYNRVWLTLHGDARLVFEDLLEEGGRDPGEWLVWELGVFAVFPPPPNFAEWLSWAAAGAAAGTHLDLIAEEYGLLRIGNETDAELRARLLVRIRALTRGPVA